VSDKALRYIYAIGKRQKLINTVETGCGRTTVILSSISENHVVFAKVDSTNRNSIGTDWLTPSNVTWVVGPTQKTLPQFEFKNKLDLVLIDGPHGYPFPELEYYFLYLHISQGGWLVVDDIQIPTVRQFFRFLCEDAMFSHVCTISNNTAFFRRTEAPLFDPYGDGWWEQAYNMNHTAWSIRAKKIIKRCFPWSIKLKKILDRFFS
jgi:hypothetical protein